MTKSPNPKWYDNSCLDDLRACPTLHYYKWERKLRPGGSEPVIPGIDVHFGSAVHSGMAALVKDLSLDRAFEAFDEVWEDGDIWFHDIPKVKKKNRHNGHLALRNWLVERAEWLSGYRTVETEFRFTVQVPGYSGPVTLYRGIIDWIGEDKETGRVDIADWKTTSYDSNSNFQASRLRNQFRGYFFGAGQSDRFRNRLGQFICDFFIVHTDDVLLHREFPIVDDWAIIEWAKGCSTDMKIADIYRAIGEWPQHTEACNRFSSICPFYRICTQPPLLREIVIEEEFHVAKEDELWGKEE